MISFVVPFGAGSMDLAVPLYGGFSFVIGVIAGYSLKK